MSEQRHFQRVPFTATILVEGPGGQHKGQLIDISLQGLLFDAPEQLPISIGDTCSLSIVLPSADQRLCFEGTLIHHSERRYGFRFVREEDETMIHLRRLLELNLGCGEEIDREIEIWLKY